MDAIALHNAGITNAVACLGTSLTTQQVTSLSKYTETHRVVLNLDGDGAGEKATHSAIANLEALVHAGQLNLKVLDLRSCKDADEFLKTVGASAYLELVEGAPSWMEWQINRLVEGKDLGQSDQHSVVVNQMVRLLGKLENVVTRSYFVNYCAQILSQGNSTLYKASLEALQRQLKRPVSVKKPPVPKKTESLLEEAEALLLAVYIHNPEWRGRITQGMEERDLAFSFSSHRYLWQLILQEQDLWEGISDHPSKEELSKIVCEPCEVLQTRTVQLIEAAIACLEKVSLEKHRAYCLHKWQETPMSEAKRKAYYAQEALVVGKKIQELESARRKIPL
jgi:DNA primase